MRYVGSILTLTAPGATALTLIPSVSLNMPNDLTNACTGADIQISYLVLLQSKPKPE